MRWTILTRLVKSEVPRIKKNSQKFTFGRDGEVWCAVCRYVLSANVCYFSLPSVFWWMLWNDYTCRVLNRITCSGTQIIHAGKCEVVLACTHTWTHMNTVPRWCAAWYSCLLSSLVLGKGLSCRSGVRLVGFHGWHKDRTTCERSWPRRGAKTTRIPNGVAG